MSRRKTQKFEDIKNMANVLEYPVDVKGKWGSEVFGNGASIVLELACGRGAYTLAMAGLFPGKNFIGVDCKGERIWFGGKTAEEDGLSNVRFLRVLIENLGDYFDEAELDEIWITFPDPYPRAKSAKHRLTAEKFLLLYKKLLKKGGRVNLKTDSEVLFQSTLESVTAVGGTVWEMNADIYSSCALNELLEIQTDFEKRHLALGRKIKFLSFTL